MQKKKESYKVKTGSKDTAEQKWCSVHKTPSHDDAECNAQGAHHARRRTRTLTLHHTLLYCLRAHLQPTTTRSRPSTLMTSTRNSFSVPVTSSDGRGFHPNVDRITMFVDSRASDHLVDDEMVPRLRDSMKIKRS